MKAKKIIWGNSDTFQSIHKKLLEMKGALVVNKQNEKVPFTIFDVGKIEKMQLSGIGNGFSKFLDGDKNYQTKDGEYNFNGMKIIPMWGFFVEYGIDYKNGKTMSNKYNFMIPKKSTYKNDAKANAIMFDNNHPFIFYKLGNLGKEKK